MGGPRGREAEGAKEKQDRKAGEKPKLPKEKKKAVRKEKADGKKKEVTLEDTARKLFQGTTEGGTLLADGKRGKILETRADARIETKLSKAERAERSRRAKPDDGIGFDHGSAKIAAEEAKRFKDQLSPARKKALISGKGDVWITTTASRTGNHETNKKLTDQRAKAIREMLINMGVKASRIKIESLGERAAEDAGRPDGKDDAEDRIGVVSFDFDKKTPQPNTPARKTESLEKTIKRAREVFKKHPPKKKEVARRLERLINKLADSKVDDAYVTGAQVIGEERYLKRSPDKIANHAREQLKRAMSDPALVHKGKGKYERVKPSDKILAARLERIENAVYSGPAVIRMKRAVEGKALSPYVQKVSDWIRSKQKRSDSIYSVYK